MRLFKKVLYSILSAIIFSSILTAGVRAHSMQASFDADLYDNVIRLHILANSDDYADQKAKYQIRDEVLSYISSLTEKAKDRNEARNLLENNICEIEKYVYDTSARLGYNYSVSVSLVEERYPVRYYNGFTFPSGEYLSLRIELGSGKGKNWWCVLYPSVCVSSASKTGELLSEAGVSENSVEYMKSEKKYKFEFYLLDLFGF